MRLSVVVVLVVLVSLSAKAATPSSDAQRCYVSARVEQHKTVTALARPLHSEGKLFYSCDHGLVWHTASPIVETLLYSNGKAHYRAVNHASPELLKDRLHRQLGTMLMAIIGGDQAYIDQHFAVLEHNDTDGNNYTLFEPKKKAFKRRMNSISLHQRADSVQVVLNYAKGEVTRIQMSDIESAPMWSRAWCEAELEPILSCEFFCQAADRQC